jgi:hypothetical protein
VEINEIKAVDQVWATDITTIPLRKGFLYLVAVARDSTDGQRATAGRLAG